MYSPPASAPSTHSLTQPDYFSETSLEIKLSGADAGDVVLQSVFTTLGQCPAPQLLASKSQLSEAIKTNGCIAPPEMELFLDVFALMLMACTAVLSGAESNRHPSIVQLENIFASPAKVGNACTPSTRSETSL